MTNADYEMESYRAPYSRSRAEEQKKPNARSGKWLPRIAVLAVWGGLLCGAFLLADHYNNQIQAKLDAIQQSNQDHVDALNHTIAGLQQQLDQNQQNAELLHKQFQDVTSQLEAVKEEMALAGDSLSSSDETKKALSQRITDLSAELQKLQTSIKKLEEAARVY